MGDQVMRSRHSRRAMLAAGGAGLAGLMTSRVASAGVVRPADTELDIGSVMGRATIYDPTLRTDVYDVRFEGPGRITLGRLADAASVPFANRAYRGTTFSLLLELFRPGSTTVVANRLPFPKVRIVDFTRTSDLETLTLEVVA